MTLFFNSETISYLGYAAIFAFISLGFLFIKFADPREQGPGLWALSFLANGLGFMLWSRVLPIVAITAYGVGELLHLCGFFLLIIGAYRFVGNPYRWWNLTLSLAILTVWLFGLWQIRSNIVMAALILKGVRAGMFMIGGLLLLLRNSKRLGGIGKGRMLTGACMFLWAAWVMLYGFIRVDALKDLLFGILVGIQVLSAFGMIVMLVENKQSRLEKTEKTVTQLEGLLPICSHCKKIRNKDGSWDQLEAYFEKQSVAEFSHGVCPECMEKHYKRYH